MNLQALAALDSRWPYDDLAYGAITMTDVQKTSEGIGKRLQMNPAHSQAIAKFAQDNGLLYQASPQQVTYSTLHPAWFYPGTPGNRPLFFHRVSGTMLGMPFESILEYTVAAEQTGRTVGANGRRVAKTQRRAIIRVTLPAVFPQVVLDSNKNDQSAVSSIPNAIKSDQRVQLEGNFSSYFDLYAPQGIAVNSLTLLAPNFMQILMDSAATFDVEFYGNELILITRDPLYTPAVMQAALTALSEQLSYINRLVQSWNYQPLTLPFDHLQYDYFNGPSTLKIGKLRLKPLTLIILILIGFVLVFGGMNLLTKSLGGTTSGMLTN